MGIQVNGSQLSWGFVAALCTVLVGVGGIQWQVFDNTEEIDSHLRAPSHAEAQTQLAVLRTTQENIQKQMEQMNAHQSAQTELLNQAVRQLAELNAKSE